MTSAQLRLIAHPRHVQRVYNSAIHGPPTRRRQYLTYYNGRRLQPAPQSSDLRTYVDVMQVGSVGLATSWGTVHLSEGSFVRNV